jgi:putative ABC transport system permease protein
MFSDLRFAFRQLAKSPGFTLVAVLTLALGIGACTAIFSVVDRVLLRPLPYPESHQLVAVGETKLPDYPEFSVSPGNYSSWCEQARSFASLAALRSDSYALTGRGEPARLNALRVTANYFATLRLPPQLGRNFLPAEDEPGHETVVLLSHGFWQRQFAGAPDVLGQTLQLNGHPFTIVGVLPPAFRDADVVTPCAFSAADRQQHGGHYLGVLGRLRPGGSLAQADAELQQIAAQLAAQFPDTNRGWGVRTATLLDQTVGEVRPVLYALLGAVGFLLLIACANIANLLLARAASRNKELAIRASQGATPARLVRQLLTESVVLAALGGALGVLIAQWGVSALLALAPENLPRADEIAVDGRALLFTGAIAILTGLIFGLAPALRASRLDLNRTLKETARGASGRRSRLRSALVVAEIAIALVLLVGSGLLIRSFARLHAVDPGFEPRGAFALGLDLSPARYGDGARQTAFVDQVSAALAAIPGVQSVGAVQVMPFSGNDYVLDFYREDLPRPAPGQIANANYYAATPGYFAALGIRLVRGRFFDAHDRADSAPVAIIGETMARRHFAGTDPLGKRIHISNSPEKWREIVGVVADTKHYGLDGEPISQMYEPFAQSPHSFLNLVVRAPAATPGLAAAVRAAIQSVDASQPIYGFASLETQLGRSVARQRFAALLFAVFSGVALLLASIGIYGVMACTVSQRRDEIGIRLALGAQRGDVLRLVLAQGARLILLGLAAGLLGTLLLSRFLAALLFGVSPHDPATFAVIAALLGLVATAACLIPAHRATRIDPLEALRAE